MRYLATLRPDSALMAVDLRGHGDSALTQHNSDNEADYDRSTNTVETCADDLHQLLSSFHREGVIREDTSITLIAHSFGGKVALKYLEQCDRRRKERASGRSASSEPSFVPLDTWIVDSIPGAHQSNLTHFMDDSLSPSGSHDAVDPLEVEAVVAAGRGTTNIQVENVLKCLYRLPLTFQSREWCINVLQSIEYDCRLPQSLALWLGTSIMEVREPGAEKYAKFMFKVEQLIDLYNDYCTVDMHDFLCQYGVSSSSSNASTDSSSNASEKGCTSTVSQNSSKREAATAPGNNGSIADLISSISATAAAAGASGATGQQSREYSRIHFLRAGLNLSWETASPRAPGETAASYLRSIISTHGLAEPHPHPLLHCHVMPHVNHWVHAEDMRGFTELVHKNSL